MAQSAPARVMAIDLFVRELGPPRMEFVIGKGASLFPDWMRINVEVRLRLESADGRQATGCSADWPSVGWLDKRADVSPRQKLSDLLEWLQAAREAFLADPGMTSPFDAWWIARERFLASPAGQQAIPLCGTFCLALMERALIDAHGKLYDLPFFEAVRTNRLGIELERLHSELAGWEPARVLPDEPGHSLLVRHTIGHHDPLTSEDVTPDQRLNDGLPQTLEEYIRRDGVRHFKIKISGELDTDLDRLKAIGQVLNSEWEDDDYELTLDGNESFLRLPEFQRLVEMLATQHSALFRRVRFIEQPLHRGNTFEEETGPAIRQIDRMVPLIIDEADDRLDSFARARELGYRGVSHKNCKGIFKSIANLALCRKWNEEEPDRFFLSAEDLTNLPPIALHQDLVVVAALGLDDAERNGHHFFRGLAYLDEATQATLQNEFPSLYRPLDETGTLNIRRGKIDLSDLLGRPGLGGLEQDSPLLLPLAEWLARFDDGESSPD